MSGLETVAALATVIGIVASPLFHTFFESLRNHLKRRSSSKALTDNQPLLIPSELLALEEAMGNIPLLLHLSMSIEKKIGGLPIFVAQLTKAAYAAEDLLDELDYEHLQLMVLDPLATGAAALQPSTGAGSSSSSQVGRFAHLKMLFTEHFPKPSRLQLPPPHSRSKVTPKRIRSTIEDLNRVASHLKDIYPLISESSRITGGGKEKGSSMVITGSRVTTSTVNSSKVYGRDEKKKEIMDILNEKEPQAISIIAILGLGGVGKTTLAQYIFNDKGLLFHFKVWICVSDEYKKKKIIKELIIDTAASREKTSIELQSITSMETLERMLKNNVENKRLLLVLDDVWSNQWTEILLPLQNIVELCKIIVTTREEKNVMLPLEFTHCHRKILVLEGLDDAVYRSLFDEHAFGTQGPSGHPKGAMLQPISWEIAKKLKGSPLAAKTVGAVLREQLDVDHWRRVQESDLWSIGNQKPGDIMPALMLSYLHLPACLQRCFSYCAIFPKDYEFQKEDLVNMWIAQSYVSCTRHDERAEDVGLHHFEDLVSRSFFTYYEESSPSCYKMHDLLHDLALFVSLKECCVYHSGNWHGDPKTCHHLSITESQKLPENLTEHLLESMKLQLEHMRTLIIDSFEKASEILKSMKRVRVVKVLKYTYSFQKPSLHDIGHLIHLRYLDLSRVDIPNVPEFIGMTLEIELGDEDPFPSLVEMKLRYVSLSFKKSQVHGRMFPKLRLMDLTNCNKLEGLTMPASLKILYVDRCDVELPAVIKGLSSLTTLNILNQDRFTSFEKEVMDSLSSLKELAIRYCNNFRSLPEGGFPGSLKKLEVVECSGELHAKLEDIKSLEWSMVQHIPDRKIRISRLRQEFLA